MFQKKLKLNKCITTWKRIFQIEKRNSNRKFLSSEREKDRRIENERERKGKQRDVWEEEK